jgi:hypothetical protein
LPPADECHGVTFEFRYLVDGSEFFRVDQRVEQVDAEADSDDQSDDGLDHVLSSSQPVASDGVDAHQDEEQNPDHEIDDVSHGANLQCDAGLLRPGPASNQYGKKPKPIRKI